MRTDHLGVKAFVSANNIITNTTKTGSGDVTRKELHKGRIQ
jgi:hypothetical protein